MLVTESLLLASVAGGASVYAAWSTPAPLYHLFAGRAADFPMPPDWRTFTFIAAIVLLSGVLAGIVPALESVNVDLTKSLKGGAPCGAAGRRRLDDLLVSAQVAMSMVLLGGGALFAGPRTARCVRIRDISRGMSSSRRSFSPTGQHCRKR